MIQNPRILYVDISLQALNPTNTLMPNLVKHAGDVTYYGPGFVDLKNLQHGIRKFIDNTGPYDVLFVGPNIPVLVEPEKWSDSLFYIRKYSVCSTDIRTNHDFLKDFFRNLGLLDVRVKLACFILLDYYGSTKRQIDRVLELKLNVLAPDAGFVESIDGIPPSLLSEAHVIRKRSRLSDAWLNFLTLNPDMVVSGLHFMAESEFNFGGLHGRMHQISVPGAEYLLRRKARQILKKSGLKLASKRIFNLFKICNKVGLPVYSNHSALKIFNISYRRGLENTQFVYAARGAFGIPVRKFFEIPASGALMICVPPVNMKNLGFVNETNYIDCNPENLIDVVFELSRDFDKAQNIARAGQDLIFREHSLLARARQLKKCLQLMCSSNYAGSSWVSGDFVVEKKSCAD